MAEPSPDDLTTAVRRPLGYQPALDGWRGIGILMVMAYHAGLRTIVPGAFLWIDGFFTVSAFLIATLLLEESSDGRSAGRVSLTAFWARRVRRLGPGLFVLLAAMALFALVADRAQLAALSGDVLATLFYAANWRSIAGGSDYFSAFVNDSPLKHTWSLAIEEQFYVVFPLLLVTILAIARTARRSAAALLGLVAVGGAALSAGWMAWLFTHGATTSRLYYGTDTRAQSLLVGVALAVWWQRPARVGRVGRVGRVARTGRVGRIGRIGRSGCVAAGAAAFVLLAAAQLVVHEDSAMLYTGGFLAAAVGQALVFRAALEPSWFQRALAWKPLVWVGGMAYGLYLVHFPLFLWLTPRRVGIDGPGLFALRFAATFAIAIPMLRFVEQPVRHRRWPRPGTSAARLAWPVAVAAIAIGALAVRAPGPEPSKPDLIALVSTTTSIAIHDAPASTQQAPQKPPQKPPPRIAVVGDSTATRLAPGIEAWAAATGDAVWVGDGARVGCPLGRGGAMHTAADASGPVNSACDWATATAVGFDGITRPTWPSMIVNWKPDLVVVSFGPWDVADRQLPGDPAWRFPGDPVYDRWLLEQMVAAVDSLGAGGARVVWLTQPPWEGATRHPPERLYRPAADPARMTRLNQLIAQAVASRARNDAVVDLASWIASTGEDARLRPDGAHFEPETAVEAMNRFLGAELLRVWRSP